MFSKSEYAQFTAELVPILNDCYVPNPTEEVAREGRYVFMRGLTAPTKEDYVYIYDKEKLADYKEKLRAMCAALPKFKEAAEEHGGVIVSFDLMPTIEIMEQAEEQELLQMFVFSEHFANLVCGAGLASVEAAEFGEIEGFYLILNKSI